MQPQVQQDNIEISWRQPSSGIQVPYLLRDVMRRLQFWKRSDHAEPKSVRAPVWRREVVLIAEDDAVIRKQLATILREDGYRVLEAADGAEALRIFKMLEVGAIDLIVTDMVMPEMNGRELVYHAGKIDPETKFIFASGYPERMAIQNGIVDSRFPFLQKPVLPDVLLATVREVLDQTNATSPA